MNKIKSFRWNVYFIKEYQLKNYPGVDMKKSRPVLVISDNEKLIHRSLIVELSTKKQNENSIFWYSWNSNKFNSFRESWILPDRIHTINRRFLTDNMKITNHKLSSDIKSKIISFCSEMLFDKDLSKFI